MLSLGNILIAEVTKSMTICQPSANNTLYEEDFYLWLQDTKKKLKEHDFQNLDLANLVEEIEAMGRSEKRELENRLITIIEHLLKLLYWTSENDYNARGWRVTVIEQRRQVQRLLQDSPSLKRFLSEIWLNCYQVAREDSLKKYQLSSEIFPIEPPFTIEDILNSNYLPLSAITDRD
jgi:hypothetical protein